jgi:hypothetical protein
MENNYVEIFSKNRAENLKHKIFSSPKAHPHNRLIINQLGDKAPSPLRKKV